MRPAVVLSLAFALASAAPAQTGYSAYVVTGGPYPTTLYGPAFRTGNTLRSVAVDPSGNIYTTSTNSIFFTPQTVEKITPDGEMAPVAGTGSATVAEGDRIPGLLAAVSPFGIAADSRGNLFISTFDRIYRLAPDGFIEWYAPVFANSIAVDGADNLYAAVNGARVVRIAPDRTVTTVAGTGEFGFTGDGGPATAARIGVTSVAADSAGNLFIADNQRIRKVDSNGIINTLLEVPVRTMTTGPDGSLYFAQDFMVKRLSPSGTIVTLAGIAFPTPYRGDGGPATSAWLAGPTGLAVDAAGNVYIADGERLRKIGADGIIRAIAGCPCLGENVPATSVQVGSAFGIVRDAAGNTYFTDQRAHMVRRISPAGILTRVAGNGESGFSGDGGPATDARLAWPAGLAVDAAGNLYIADTQNDRIRRVSPAGIIQTVAGNGDARYAGDGGPATAASLGLPEGVAVDAAGNVYIADTASHRIRKVTTDGIIQTIAGSDQFGTGGDGGPALQAQMVNPRMLAFDRAGNLLFTDSAAHVVRRITPAGLIERVAGTGQAGVTGDGGPALSARLELPYGVAVDAAGNIYIGDRGVRMIDTSGIIRTLVTNFPLFQGSSSTFGVAADPNGDVWAAIGTVSFLSRGGPPFPLGPEIGGSGVTFNPPPVLSLVSPGEIVTISGLHMGPDPAVASADRTGPLATMLAGTRVFFDGTPAPLLSVGAGSITAVVPYALEGKSSVSVTAEVNGLRSNTLKYAVLPAAPRVLQSSGVGGCFSGNTSIPIAAALNPDGRPNGFGSFAPLGSIVSLFATGTGPVRPPTPDGTIATANSLPVPALPVSVTTGNRQLEVTYAGGAPGLVAGATQINVRLPNESPTSTSVGVPSLFFPLDLRIGTAKAGTVCVFVR